MRGFFEVFAKSITALLLFRAALGVKAGGREDMSVVVGLIIRSRIQSLTALESEYNESPEEDNGSGAGLVSHARMRT